MEYTREYIQDTFIGPNDNGVSLIAKEIFRETKKTVWNGVDIQTVQHNVLDYVYRNAYMRSNNDGEYVECLCDKGERVEPVCYTVAPDTLHLIVHIISGNRKRNILEVFFYTDIETRPDDVAKVKELKDAIHGTDGAYMTEEEVREWKGMQSGKR